MTILRRRYCRIEVKTHQRGVRQNVLAADLVVEGVEAVPGSASLSRATPSAVSERCSELIGRPISRYLTTSCVCLELRPLPSPVTRLQKTTRLSATPRHPACPSRASGPRARFPPELRKARQQRSDIPGRHAVLETSSPRGLATGDVVSQVGRLSSNETNIAQRSAPIIVGVTD